MKPRHYHSYQTYDIKQQPDQSGFTLLEIMVVLVLIGLTVSYVLPNLKPGDSQRAIESEAKRFSALVQIAHEQALTTGKDFGVEVTDSGYTFMLWQQNRWQPVKGDRLLKAVTLDNTITIRLFPGESVWHEALEQESQSNKSFFSDKDSNKQKEPNIFIWSSGDLTPADIHFSSRKKTP